MKAATKSLLKKINKLLKDQTLAEYVRKVDEINEENQKLDFIRQKLQNEIIYEKNYDDKSIMMNYSSNWKNALIEQMSKQQSKILSLASGVELARIAMEDAAKKSVLYDKLFESQQ